MGSQLVACMLCEPDWMTAGLHHMLIAAAHDTTQLSCNQTEALMTCSISLWCRQVIQVCSSMPIHVTVNNKLFTSSIPCFHMRRILAKRLKALLHSTGLQRMTLHLTLTVRLVTSLTPYMAASDLTKGKCDSVTEVDILT